MHGAEQRVAAHQIEVSAQLFDASCSQSTLTTITNTFVQHMPTVRTIEGRVGVLLGHRLLAEGEEVHQRLTEGP